MLVVFSLAILCVALMICSSAARAEESELGGSAMSETGGDGSSEKVDTSEEASKEKKSKQKKSAPAREVTNLKVTPLVGGAKLEWDLNLPDVDRIEIYGKYFNDQHFWRYESFPRYTRAVVLPLDPLCPVVLRVHLVFRDGSWSKGVSTEITPLHKNVVYDECEGRTLLVYLPDGYEEDGARYPVIYMHDGQNLFAERLAFVEDWQIDRMMDRLIAEKKIPRAVVVGIYNSSKRAEEYTPFADKRYGGGKAREFSTFVVEKIIPYIEKKYRVSSSREDRAVMGSSFGGILSLWMGYAYPDVFSTVGAISPSMWIADGAMLEELEQQPKRPIKIWIDQGTREWSTITRNAVSLLISKGYRYGEELVYYEVKDAPHNELAWAARVECAYILFKGKPRGKCIDIRLDVQHIRMFNVGPTEVIINPIGHFENGMWHSLYTLADYEIQRSEIQRSEVGGQRSEVGGQQLAGAKSETAASAKECTDPPLLEAKTSGVVEVSSVKAAETVAKLVKTEHSKLPDVTATIDCTGVIQFNRDRKASVIVRYEGIERRVTVANPNPPELEPVDKGTKLEKDEPQKKEEKKDSLKESKDPVSSGGKTPEKESSGKKTPVEESSKVVKDTGNLILTSENNPVKDVSGQKGIA